MGSLVQITSESESSKKAIVPIPIENHYNMAETRAQQIILQAEELQRPEEMAQMTRTQREEKQEALQRGANAPGHEREVNLATVMGWFTGSPDEYNPTNATIEEYHKALEMKLKAELEADAADVQKRVKESGKRGAEVREREADILKRDAQRREFEANASVLESERRAAEAWDREEQVRRDLQQAKFYLERGIQPEVWPTEEEFQLAKNRIQYDPAEKLHFAVCGSSGSGKSSLINAFRGLRNSSPQAAPTGVVETTRAITHFPDLRRELPYTRLVWFDCPGAGTLEIPGWQYFNQQGLFIFDIIVLVYDSVIISIKLFTAD